jgi:hypothetical protein
LLRAENVFEQISFLYQ